MCLGMCVQVFCVVYYGMAKSLMLFLERDTGSGNNIICSIDTCYLHQTFHLYCTFLWSLKLELTSTNAAPLLGAFACAH